MQTFYVSLSWLYSTTTLSSLPTFILEFMFRLSIRDIIFIIKIDQLYEITLWGGSIRQLLYFCTWKCFCLLWSFLGYNYQWLELMNHKSCVRKNYKIREDIFVFLCQLQNIHDEKILEYMFILLLHDFSWFIYCGCLCLLFWNLIVEHIMSFLPENLWWQTLFLNLFFENIYFHISLESSPEINLFLCTYFLYPSHQLFQIIKVKDVQLQWQK